MDDARLGMNVKHNVLDPHPFTYMRRKQSAPFDTRKVRHISDGDKVCRGCLRVDLLNLLGNSMKARTRRTINALRPRTFVLGD